MAMLAARTNAPVEPVEAVGLDGDMLEAQAFAYLAVRVLRGLPTSAPGDHRRAAAGLGRADQPAVGWRIGFCRGESMAGRACTIAYTRTYTSHMLRESEPFK